MPPGTPLADHLAALAAPADAAMLLGLADGAARIAGMLAAGAAPDAAAAWRAVAAALPDGAGPASWLAPSGVEVVPGGEGPALAVAPLVAPEAGAGVAPATMFSLLPARAPDPADSFLQPGKAQTAAGYILHGPRTTMALALGEGGVALFEAGPDGLFRLAGHAPAIPAETDCILADAGASRGWDPAPRAFLEDCLAGAEGPRGRRQRILATGSPVADLHAVLTGGGLMLRPAGGVELSRLHLAQPIAFLVEAAGGAATDGRDRLLDAAPRRSDATAPLICGAAREVARIAAWHDLPLAEDSPLFGRRGLFRI